MPRQRADHTRRLLLYNKAFRADPTAEIKTHEGLIAEVLTGDADRAEAAVREHVRASTDLVLVRMPDEG